MRRELPLPKHVVHRPNALVTILVYCIMFAVSVAFLVQFLRKTGGIFVAAAITLIIFWLVLLAREPLQVRVYERYFTVQYPFRSRQFSFSDVRYVASDDLVGAYGAPRYCVKIDFHNRRSLFICEFTHMRDSLYRAISKAWSWPPNTTVA